MWSSIPDHWEMRAVDEIAKVVGGGTPSTKNEEYFGGSVPWLTPNDLSEFNGKYIGGGERSLTQEGLENSSAQLLPRGTVLLTSRAPVGYVAIADRKVATNQGFRSLVVKEGYNNEYIYYLLRVATPILESRASGTTFSELSGRELGKIELPIPPISEQRTIAHRLSLLDEKLLLNRSIAHNLRGYIQMQYQLWFAGEMKDETTRSGDVDASEAEASVRRGSGGGEESERTLKMEEMVKVESSRIEPGEYPEEEFYHYSFPAYDESRRPVVEKGRDIGSAKYVVPSDAVMISKLNPRFQRVWLPLVRSDRRSIASTEFLVCSPRETVSREFLFSLFRSSGFQGRFKSLATGTTGSRQRVRKSDFRSMEVLLPSDSAIRGFSRHTGDVAEYLLNNRNEIWSLERIRDSLNRLAVAGNIVIDGSG